MVEFRRHPVREDDAPAGPGEVDSDVPFDGTGFYGSALDAELAERAAQLGLDGGMVEDFILRTPALTASEQVQLLTTIVENTVQRPSPRSGPQRGTRPSGGMQQRPGSTRQRPGARQGGGGVDWGSIARGLQTGLGLFQTGAQVAGGLAGTFGGDNQTARDVSLWANRLGQGAGQFGSMLQALQAREIPPLPGAGGGLSPMLEPSATPLQQPRPAVLPGRPRAPVDAGASPTGVQQFDATALLGLLLNNPQVMQSIMAAPALAQPAASQVPVAVPNIAPVSIPLRDIMGTIARLAQGAMEELAGPGAGGDLASEGDIALPDYLYGEDGDLIVDPANREERAALALHWLRLQGEAGGNGLAVRYGPHGSASGFGSEMPGLDTSDLWARDAGLDHW